MTTELMAKERLSPNIPLFALEGMGGSGKSHVIRLLASQLNESGLNVLGCKISGMGSGDRIDRLRCINAARKDLLENGLASEKIKEDKRKDRIFRLAMHHQVKSLIKQTTGTNSGFDIAILDRTPMMPWVYSASNDPDNPYLEEILNDGLRTTAQMGISSVYVLDVSPETAFARMIGRMCVGKEDFEKMVADLCKIIKAPDQASHEIATRSINFITNNHGLTPKTYEKYALIPYDVMVNERSKFVEAAMLLNSKLGIGYKVVDAEKPIDQVVTIIIEDMRVSLARASA